MNDPYRSFLLLFFISALPVLVGVLIYGIWKQIFPQVEDEDDNK